MRINKFLLASLILICLFFYAWVFSDHYQRNTTLAASIPSGASTTNAARSSSTPGIASSSGNKTDAAAADGTTSTTANAAAQTSGSSASETTSSTASSAATTSSSSPTDRHTSAVNETEGGIASTATNLRTSLPSMGEAVINDIASTNAGTATNTATTSSVASDTVAYDPSVLNLNDHIDSPITQNTRGCYSLNAAASSVTFKLSGPISKTLDTITSDKPMTYCCDFVVNDLPNGTYTLAIEITRGSTSTDSKVLEIKTPNTLEAIAQIANTILQDKCASIGVTNMDTCKSTLIDQYAKTIKCQNLNDADCQASLKKTFSDAVIVIEDRYKRIEANVNDSLGKDFTVYDLEAIINKDAATQDTTIPIQTKGTEIKAMSAVASIVMDKAQGLIEAAPIAIAIDSDGDGIPDDIENRIGTDPQKIDTDNDGYPDGEEILNGYDPLGPGKRAMQLSPVEKAIINNRALDHPKTSGIEKGSFSVDNITNNAADGYIISGKAQPGSVATVYIYSDIPIVTTVTTDQNGNWQYEFDQPLSDGDHEIYVAINDETGKVTVKSKPLDFTVKQAKAISPAETAAIKDVANVQKNTPSTKTNSTMKYYIISLVAILIIVAIAIFIFIVLKKKNKINQ